LIGAGSGRLIRWRWTLNGTARGDREWRIQPRREYMRTYLNTVYLISFLLEEIRSSNVWNIAIAIFRHKLDGHVVLSSRALAFISLPILSHLSSALDEVSKCRSSFI
jgi:hypothetical protein